MIVMVTRHNHQWRASAHPTISKSKNMILNIAERKYIQSLQARIDERKELNRSDRTEIRRIEMRGYQRAARARKKEAASE